MKKDKTEAKDLQHKNSTPDTPLVTVTVPMNAEAERIFVAFSSSDMIKEWWGPETFTCPFSESDFRVGGKYLRCIESPGGDQVWSTGHYIKIVDGSEIICADSRSNESGDLVKADQGEGGPFAEAGVSYITLELKPAGDGETAVTISHEGLPARMYEDCVDGWHSSLKKLKRLVETH